MRKLLHRFRVRRRPVARRLRRDRRRAAAAGRRAAGRRSGPAAGQPGRHPATRPSPSPTACASSSTRTARRRSSRSASGTMSARRTSRPASTGFAHLFEHLMFNGSENAPGDYFEPLAQIGATDLNGTTWFDRTNYFQTVPRPRARARAVPRERPDGPSARRGRPRRSSTTSAASSRTRSARATTSPTAWSNMPSSKALFPEAIPIATRRSARWPISTPPASTTCSDWFREQLRPEQRGAGPRRRHRRRRGAAAGRALFRRHPARPGQRRRPQAAVPTLPARVDRVMHDRVATTRLYRNWVVPGLDRRGHGAARGRRRRPRRPRQLAARQCAGARRADRGRGHRRRPDLPAGQHVRGRRST